MSVRLRPSLPLTRGPPLRLTLTLTPMLLSCTEPTDTGTLLPMPATDMLPTLIPMPTLGTSTPMPTLLTDMPTTISARGLLTLTLMRTTDTTVDTTATPTPTEDTDMDTTGKSSQILLVSNLLFMTSKSSMATPNSSLAEMFSAHRHNHYGVGIVE